MSIQPVRPRGAGSIRKKCRRPGWEAYTPQGKGVRAVKIGDFAMYHQAEKALDEWLRANAQKKAG